jgi:GNAT superfamily N-acetyltransferase
MHETEGDFIERRGCCDWYRALPADTAAAARAAVVEVGPVALPVLAAVPSAVYSRVLGLGVEEPATPELVDAVLAELRRLGVSRAFAHVGPYSRPSGFAQWLVDRGLTRYRRSWMRFVREREAVSEARTELSMRPAQREDCEALDAVACEAFEVPDVARGAFGAVVGRPGWHVFVAADGDKIVGVGSLFVENDLGWVAFGSVAQSSRGRGAQSALLQARIQQALDLGCRAIFTETGEAVPGDPQHSYRNILRAGFRELVLRDNYLYAP